MVEHTIEFFHSTFFKQCELFVELLLLWLLDFSTVLAAVHLNDGNVLLNIIDDSGLFGGKDKQSIPYGCGLRFADSLDLEELFKG